MTGNPANVLSVSLAEWTNRMMLRFGTMATLTRPASNVYQPATGTFASVTESTQAQSFTVKGFFEQSKGQPIAAQQFGGDLSDTHSRSHRFLIPESADVPFDTLVGWTLTLAERVYSVRKVLPEYVQGVVVFYGLVLDGA